MRMPGIVALGSCAMLLLATGESRADTFELNTTKGLWQLDNSLVARYATSQGPLVAAGFTIGAAPNSRFANESGAQHLIINSSTAPFTGLKPAETFRMPNPVGPNGPAGAAYTNVWTVVMDVRFPTLSSFTYTNLLQDLITNGDEGEIFINPARQLQFYGAIGPSGAEPVASDPLTANTWYRLAFTSTYDSVNDRQILRAYVNGVVTSQTSGGAIYAPRDGRYGLVGNVALFSDNNDETAVTHLGGLGFWGRALSGDDVEILGSYSGNALVWPGLLQSNATPPLPLLTGRILFGNFVGNFTPPTGAALIALANSAVSSSYPGAVCQVTLPLGSIGGTVAGFSSHVFGGNLTVAVLANGDVVSRVDTALTYVGSGPDLSTIANVTFSRGQLILSSDIGLYTTGLTVYFPAGMNVAMDANTRFAYDRANISAIVLGQTLAPTVSPVISKGNFPNHTGQNGTIYPSTERIPVRFAAANITWNPGTGQFQFPQTGNVLYHQAQQLAFLSPPPMGTIGAVIPKSNDLVFFCAKNVTGTVNFGSRTGGISTAQAVTFSLDPAALGAPSVEYSAHHPVIRVKWTGAGSISYSGNAITAASSLPGAVTSRLIYARSVAKADCQGIGGGFAASPEDSFFLPTSRIWRFTPDGGIRADGTVADNLDNANDIPSGNMVPRWAAYVEDGFTRFAHQITGGFTSGRVMTAGNAVVGSEISALDPLQRVYGLIGAGHSSPSSSSLVERPGAAAFKTGAADYPGINLRAAAGTIATSYIAGISTGNYPLAATAKYYFRTAGVSALHTSSAATPISLSAYGGSLFNLSSLQLSFLDGLNKGSGVNGNITVPTPNSTNFTLGMKRILFGPQGQIQNASLAFPQADITLSYWNFQFSPLAIDFPQPEGCPPPPPSQAFVRISAKATLPALTTTPVVGNLGFFGGDLVTSESPIAAGQKNVSRFEPGPALVVPGPAGKNWAVNCTTGIYLNQKAAAGSDPGSLNAGGLMNLPFFNDMEVHLRTPSATGGNSPLLHVRSALSSLALTNYDPAHRGRPDGVDLATYLARTLPPPQQAYNPVASKKWQNLITFSYPVAFQDGSNTFRSQTNVSGPVLLFPLSQGVKIMTPDAAELLFDGQISVGVDSFLPQINLSTLATGTPIPSIQGFINPMIDAVAKLDSLLADDINPLLKSSLQTASTNQATSTFYNTLKISSDRNATIDTLLNGLSNDIISIFGSETSGLNGKARREIEDKIELAADGLAQAENLIASAQQLQNLAAGIALASGAGNSPALPEAARLSELKVLFDRAEADLTAAKSSVGAPLATALNASFGGQPIIRASIDAALKDLRKKWAPADPTLATALYQTKNRFDFAADLADALSDRIGGSSFTGNATGTLRRFLGDPQYLTRQVTDDTLALASSLLQGLPSSAALAAIGSELGDKLFAADLKGYAHINGDSLHELRLDGGADLDVGADKMGFDARFILRDVDSSTPEGACLAASGAAAEVIIGASTSLAWTGQDVDIDIEGKVAFDSGGTPIGLCGDLKLVGTMGFNAIELNELGLGFGYGAGNYYFYGKGAAKLASMDVAAGIFIGRTCSLDPIKNADPDIGQTIAGMGLTPPFTGAAVYAFGSTSLMPIIGIPPSCLLDLRIGGGQGFFLFDTSGALVGGFKTTVSVGGELLCIASVGGRLDTVIAGAGEIAGGSPEFTSLEGNSRFTLSGSVGYGWLSYDFEKSLGLKVRAIPTPVKFSIDF